MAKDKKFVNPVEKARRLAKIKEVKKQKKQKIEARALNIKSKDPYQLMSELERLDEIEYNTEEPVKLNEKVISNKRKKLKETWYRILSFYKKEDITRYNQLKKLEYDYESKRNFLIKKYEAINSAKQVNLEEIPLPFGPDDKIDNSLTNLQNLDDEPCTDLALTDKEKINKEPPGCPAYEPPSLEELEKELMPSNDLDEFLKEIDQVEKFIASNSQETMPSSSNSSSVAYSKQQSLNSKPNLMNLPMFKPPMPCSTFPIIPDPLGYMNSIKKPNMPFRPPILPQGQQNRPNLLLNPSMPSSKILPKKEEKVATVTIEAKPQLRNLSADATRFLPSSLRIKRQEIKKPIKPIESFTKSTPTSTVSKPANEQNNKDSAYEEFMNELKGLI